MEVTRVDADSPAEKAGLKAGDAVLEYQGNRVKGAEQFVRFVRETPVGRQVKLKIVRAGANQTMTASIGARKSGVMGLSQKDREQMEKEMAVVREKLKKLPEIRMPDIPQALIGSRSGMLGIDGEAVEDQLAAFFGVNEGVPYKFSPAGKREMAEGKVNVPFDARRIQKVRPQIRRLGQIQRLPALDGAVTGRGQQRPRHIACSACEQSSWQLPCSTAPHL